MTRRQFSAGDLWGRGRERPGRNYDRWASRWLITVITGNFWLVMLRAWRAGWVAASELTLNYQLDYDADSSLLLPIAPASPEPGTCCARRTHLHPSRRCLSDGNMMNWMIPFYDLRFLLPFDIWYGKVHNKKFINAKRSEMREKSNKKAFFLFHKNNFISHRKNSFQTRWEIICHSADSWETGDVIRLTIARTLAGSKSSQRKIPNFRYNSKPICWNFSARS